MTDCYGPLAQWYDRLTGDVPYALFADFYEAEFARRGGDYHLLLDLCCGTGTLSAMMTARGYELLAADASEDMLMRAREKAAGLSPAPVFLCQEAARLDLYGTVDAAYCSLDGLNYIPPEELPEVFRRLGLFIRPGGLFIFDIRPPRFLRSLDGSTFVDETEDVLCLWRADYDGQEACLVYGMDLFSREGALWRRSEEEHVEYAHSIRLLSALLSRAGFQDIRIVDDPPPAGKDRLFISAVRGEEKENDHG